VLPHAMGAQASVLVHRSGVGATGIRKETTTMNTQIKIHAGHCQFSDLVSKVESFTCTGKSL